MTSRLAGSAAIAALALLLCDAGAHAQGISYRCMEANGIPLYTDVFKPGCKLIEGQGLIQAPPQRRGPAPAPARTAAVAASTPADFPKVGGAQQRARDDGRREILNDELRSEENKLADLRREFNGGEPERQGNERNYAKYQERVAQMKDNIGRAEKNIDALKREIANIK